MEKKYANSKISNFIIPFFIFLFTFIISYFSNQQKMELRLFYFPISLFFVLSAFIYWQMSIFRLTADAFIIKYPFKYPFERFFNFKLTDIVLMKFIDPKVGRAGFPKVEVHYKKDNTIKVLLLQHDIKYSKVQLLINELRNRGILVQVQSLSLK